MKKYLTFKNLLIIFLLIQPIFDLIWFYGSVSTLIRITIILLLFGYTIIKYKDFKTIFVFAIYLTVITTYLMFHHSNCLAFHSLIPGNFNYSLFEEILYLIKMCSPFLLIYTVYKNVFNEKEISLTYKIIIGLISGSIILTNILGISFSTYANEHIKANFIMWFFGALDQYDYQELASRGLFYFPNHIVAILLLTIPIMFYIMVNNFKKVNLSFFIILLLSMILLGNKISVFGTLMVLITLIIIYFIFTKLTKEITVNCNLIVSIVTITIVYVGLMFISPAYERIITLEGVNPKYESNDSIKQEEIDYIRLNYKDKKIQKNFIEKAYPYEYDPDFWYGILQEPLENRVDYRFIETKIMDRVIEINDNPNDKLLGIGYSRQMNIFNVERDYLNQYYSLGIIGTAIILGPFLIMVGYLSAKTLSKKHFKFKNVIFLFSVYLILIAAYFSGNLFNSLSVMIPLAYVYGIALENINHEKV